MFAWRIFKYILLLVALIFFLIYTGLNYVVAPYLVSHLPELTEPLGIEVHVESIYFYPFYPAIDVKGVVVKGNRGEVAKIDLVSLTFSPLAFFRKEIKLYHLLIRKGKIQLVTDSNFRPLNITLPSSHGGGDEGQKGSELKFSIGDLVVEKLHLLLDVKDSFILKQEIRAVTFNFKRGRGVIFLDRGNFNIGSLQFKIARGEFPVDLADENFAIDNGVLELVDPDAELKFGLEIVNLNNPYISLKFTGKSTLDFLNRQLFSYPHLKGNVLFDGSLRAGKDVPFLLMGVLKGKGAIEDSPFTINRATL